MGGVRTSPADCKLDGVTQAQLRFGMPKPPPIPVSSIDVRAIRGQARQFGKAAQLCIPEPMRNGVLEGPITPGIVCASFAVELWFKAMLCAGNPTGILPLGHNLLDLFDSLPESVRLALIEKCDLTSPEFLEFLAEDARVFETWRYSYEHGALATEPVHALSANTGMMFKLFRACDVVDEHFYRQ